MSCCWASRSPDQTRELGARLAGVLRPGDVVGLRGELGAGKTCLVQGIARGLGVDPRVPVTSPTFTLVGEYPGRVPLRHADFYRVESYQRLDDCGFDDLFDGRAVVVVEWPERFPAALPEERLEVSIAIRGERERELSLAGSGARPSAIRRDLEARWP